MTTRLTYLPTVEELTRIEGTTIVDIGGDDSVRLAATGVCGVVGEFADQSTAHEFNGTTGEFVAKPRAVDILGLTGFRDLLGGYDSTIGDHGRALGNGYTQLQNIRFPSLVAIVVPTAATFGVALTRELPLARSASDARPATPLETVRVPAGTPVIDGSQNSTILCRSCSFEASDALGSATDATLKTGVASRSHKVESATLYALAKPGDVLVLGHDADAAGAAADTAGAYQVVSLGTSPSVNVVRFKGSIAVASDITARPWTLYPIQAAISSDAGILDGATREAYNVPVRPLVANIPASTQLAPLDPVTSGALNTLTAHAHSAGAITHVAAIHVANAPNDTAIDALYELALEAINVKKGPGKLVTRLLTSRSSPAIRAAAGAMARKRSRTGRGVIFFDWLELDTTDPTTLITAPEVNNLRHDRVIRCWPGRRTLNASARFIPTRGADGVDYDDGVVDVDSAGVMASLCSILPPERNPAEHSGQALDIISDAVLDFQRGIDDAVFNDETLIALRNRGGVCTLREEDIDGVERLIFQSGITLSTASGNDRNANNRMFRDFLGDTIGATCARYQKQIVGRTRGIAPLPARLNAFLGQLVRDDRMSEFVPVVLDLTRSRQNIVGVPIRYKPHPTADFILVTLEVTPENVTDTTR